MAEPASPNATVQCIMTAPPTDRVDPKLLEILVCPLTKGPLEYDAEKQELISRSAKLAYPDPRRHPDHAAGRSAPSWIDARSLGVIIRASG